MVQEGYREDAEKYAEQVRRYNMDSLDGVKLRGISRIDDTRMQMVHFSYGGDIYKLVMGVDEDLNSQLRLKLQQIREMYEQENEGN